MNISAEKLVHQVNEIFLRAIEECRKEVPTSKVLGSSDKQKKEWNIRSGECDRLFSLYYDVHHEIHRVYPFPWNSWDSVE